jgi:hypothetical protein
MRTEQKGRGAANWFISVISETWALQVAVIPAKAGIHSGPPQNNRTDFLSLDKRDKIG